MKQVDTLIDELLSSSFCTRFRCCQFVASLVKFECSTELVRKARNHPFLGV